MKLPSDPGTHLTSQVLGTVVGIQLQYSELLLY